MAYNKGKSGGFFPCKVCGKEFYRTPGQIKGGSTKCCSKICQRVQFSGKGNPFYGRTHSEDSIKKMIESHTGRPNPNKGRKGWNNHTPESRMKISEFHKKHWAENRESRLASLRKNEHLGYYNQVGAKRHRKHFTPTQKREWKDTSCFYCGATDDLVLDHIIPIFDGGGNHRENCQTLCRPCNRWKSYAVDLPRYRAAQTSKGADIDPL